MTDSLPILVKNAVKIAWDYLEATGEIEEGVSTVASRFPRDVSSAAVQ